MKKTVVSVVLSVLLLACNAPGERPLLYPNQVLAPQMEPLLSAKKSGAMLPKLSCMVDDVPPHTGALQFVSKYKGSGRGRDELNKAAHEKYKAATAAITKLEKTLSKLSRWYVAERYARHSIADCYLEILNHWAESKALLHADANHTGASVRKWALATISANYLVVRPGIAQDDSRLPVVTQWLTKLGQQVIREWSDRPTQKVNNHDFWAAWAMMATAVALDNKTFYAWSIFKYKEGVALVSSEGIIQKELSRRTRALAYHNYALSPLLFIAHFAHANGDDFLSAQDAGIRRLIHYVVSGLNDPDYVSEKLGYEQNLEGVYTPYGLAWIPLHNYYFDEKDLGGLGTSTKRYASTRLGGDVLVPNR